MDAIAAKWLWKEWDDLLWVVEELLMGIDPARMEHADAHWWINLLEDELQRERDLKVAAEGVSVGLAMEVGQCQEEIQHLEAKVTRQHDEVHKLWADVNGKSLVSLVVFLPGIHGKPFDMVRM